MTYRISKDDGILTVHVSGHLDINSSTELDQAIEPELEGTTDLIVDLANVDYVSSMGLRLLLSWQKRMFKQGSMRVVNVSDEVKELFDQTGFSEILDISQ